jgi:Tfp pilus assembly protein PilZ
MQAMQTTHSQRGSETPDSILLALNIESATELQQVFVPIIEGGGLFIPRQQLGRHAPPITIGAAVFLLLRISNPDYQDALTGRVVWLKPASGSSGKCKSGFAVQFLEGGDRLRQLLDNQPGSGTSDQSSLAIFD